MITIRASSLPTWEDCPRRWIATQRRHDLLAAGYALGDRPPSIGAHVGTGAHAAVATSWMGVMSAGRWADLEDADAAGIEALRARSQDDGVSWDDTTPDLNAAEHAVRKITRAYRDDIQPGHIPVLVEAELRCRVGEGFELVGHTDLVKSRSTRYDAAVRQLDDLKTGVQMPSPGAQLGGYDLLLDASGEPIERATMTYVRRVRKAAEQPRPMTVRFERAVIRRQARRATIEIVDTTRRFQLSGDIMEFRANPQSRLCGPRYCPAFNSRACAESCCKASA